MDRFVVSEYFRRAEYGGSDYFTAGMEHPVSPAQECMPTTTALRYIVNASIINMHQPH